MMTLTVETSAVGERLDRYVTNAIPAVSRSQVAQWIADGRVLVNGVVPKAKQTMRKGDVVHVTPPAVAQPSGVLPENLPLTIVYDDDDIVVINKAPGMVVHPGAGRTRGTVVNALLARYPGMFGVGGVERPGIVHRLDQGTSGVMVIAKHDQAHRALVAQFAGRQTVKWYLAVCWGRPAVNGKSDLSIGRHPVHRQKMSTQSTRGRTALSHWTVQEYLQDHASLLQVQIFTGRTHQIRVHLSAAGFPLIGDAVYGGVRALARCAPDTAQTIREFRRPALHAWRLRLTHPMSGVACQFEAPLPDDMRQLIAVLRAGA